MKQLSFVILATVSVALMIAAATTNPAKYGMMTSSDGSGNPGTWVATSGSGTPYTGSVTPAGLMVSSDGTGNPGTWVAATPTTFLSSNNPTFTGTLTGPTVSAVNYTAPAGNELTIVPPTGHGLQLYAGSGNNIYVNSGMYAFNNIIATGFQIWDGSSYYWRMTGNGSTFNINDAASNTNEVVVTPGTGVNGSLQVAGTLRANLTVLTTQSAITSAATIAPTNQFFHVTGTVTISTITPPTICTAWAAQGACQITIIPDAIFATNTTGNIALASTAVVNKALILTYDGGTTKWYPSY